MKSLMPWFCILATGVAGAANEGIDAYRQGDYLQAAQALTDTPVKDPVVNYYLGNMRLYGYGQLKNNILAIRYFKQAAEKGFLPAQNLMARYELLHENNPEQALYWFKKAAEANDVAAQMYCSAAYLFGFGVKKNQDTARRYIIAAAKNGNAIAQTTLAEQFLEGKNLANKKLALIWLNKAVDQKDPHAQLLLGALYAEGKVVPQDLNKAQELIGLANAQGYLPALLEMGKLARAQNDFSKAKEWYTKGADKNYIPAQFALGQLYMDKNSPIFDTQLGFLWLLKAAQNDSIEAQLLLAKLYQEGQLVTKDENLAKEWQTKAQASSKDNPIKASLAAANWLSNNKVATIAGSGYQLKGIFTAWENPRALKQNNYNQAPQLQQITRASLYQPKFQMSEPNSIAMNEYYDALSAMLGNLQSSTFVFPRYSLDDAKALIIDRPLVPNSPLDESAQQPNFPVEEELDVLALLTPLTEEPAKPKTFFENLYSQAILGNPAAQFAVGQMYQEGIETSKNIPEAIKFYQLAAEQKDLRAHYNLGLLFLEGKDVAPDYIQASMWLSDAAFMGNGHAQFTLGRLMEQGYKDEKGEEVLHPDHDQAVGMYYLAAANNYGQAHYRLAEILVREKPTDMSIAAREKRNQTIKNLYERAVAQHITEASLPLAFFDAMDTDKNKQARAFAVAKAEAAKGNAQAALLLGLLYDRGIGTERNQTEAIYWYQQASSNPVSAFILGTYFSQGIGVEKDEVKGKSLMQQAADTGFSYANLNLAVMKQQQGEPFLAELDAARALGNSKAGLLLADYYLSQANDDQKMQQAREIYQHFADKGDREGQVKLAFMFEQGLGGQVDKVSAQKWYSLAAAQGQPVAQYLLGRIYQMGWLDKQPDYAEAKKWFDAAKTNYSPAAVALGFIYDTVDDDYKLASTNYEIAAAKQDPIAQFNLGLIYEKGKGRAVDFVKARDLYTQAAASGHTQAMVQLAGLYFNGLAGPRDEQQALELYKKAAQAGDNEALYQLGLLSETGVATKLDSTDAVNYYQQSATKGNAKAMLALARMYQFGLGVEKDNQLAEKYYKQLATLDNPYAQYQLATFYYEGLTGQRSPEQGKRLLIQAQENGSQQAKKALQWLDAQSQDRLSYIEPVSIRKTPQLAGQPADLMYLDALNEWNRGDEQLSRIILDKIRLQFPQYTPAKRAYEQLYQQLPPGILG